MAFEPIIRLALGKVVDEAEAQAMAPVLAAAIALDAAERGFGKSIEASKAARGEGPTKLGRSRRTEVDQYAADADAMDQELLRSFAQFGSAASIVGALRMGLEQDVQFWAKAHKKAHPGDAAVLGELVASKAALLDAVATYLAGHAARDEDEDS